MLAGSRQTPPLFTLTVLRFCAAEARSRGHLRMHHFMGVGLGWVACLYLFPPPRGSLAETCPFRIQTTNVSAVRVSVALRVVGIGATPPLPCPRHAHHRRHCCNCDTIAEAALARR